MLLLNKTLLRMAKGLWRWIFLITGLKLAVLVGLAAFARIISGFLGNVASPAMTAGDGARAVASALLTAVIMLLLELLTGEAQYRCTAKARQTLRGGIFSKVLELDVGNVEKIGPVSAITSSVDGVEFHAGLLQPVPAGACSTACWRLFTCSFSCGGCRWFRQCCCFSSPFCCCR